MKTRSIIFNKEMILALLDGTKTQTRRLMKVQRPSNNHQLVTLLYSRSSCGKKDIYKNHWAIYDGLNLIDIGRTYFTNPFGNVGDLLYVRETTKEDVWGCVSLSKYSADENPVLIYEIEDEELIGAVDHWGYHNPVRPSIHMLRKNSRLTLKITDIRTERVQEITEDDAIKEGFCPHERDIGGRMLPIYPKFWFKRLWNSIYKNWHDNPSVWVCEFKVIFNNVDEYLKNGR